MSESVVILPGDIKATPLLREIANNYNYDPDFCARYGIPQTKPPFVVFFFAPFQIIYYSKLC